MPRPSALLAAAGAAGAAAYVADRRAKQRTSRSLASLRARLVEELAPPEQLLQEAVVATLTARPAPQERIIGTPVTDLVTARLAPEDPAAVEAALEGTPKDLFEASAPIPRRRLTLNFAAAYGLEDVLERAGLSAATPPDDVHSMARGPIAAGGDSYLADLVVDALQHAGLDLPERGTVLDFGASSGRVLRMVAAARPDLACVGCDPNEGAIAWAAEHLPMARFFVSPQRPPLDLPDESVAFAYAISIWSHFAEAPALQWLEELHRVLEPGGALVLTTHGFDCLTTLLRRGHISRQTAVAATRGMIRDGHHFVDVFGPEGDWGVQDPEWGNAYLTLDWLQSRTPGAWSVRLLWSGGLDDTQDVIVLQKR